MPQSDGRYSTYGNAKCNENWVATHSIWIHLPVGLLFVFVSFHCGIQVVFRGKERFQALDNDNVAFVFLDGKFKFSLTICRFRKQLRLKGWR